MSLTARLSAKSPDQSPLIRGCRAFLFPTAQVVMIENLHRVIKVAKEVAKHVLAACVESSAQEDLNFRPSDYESPALTAELWSSAMRCLAHDEPRVAALKPKSSCCCGLNCLVSNRRSSWSRSWVTNRGSCRGLERRSLTRRPDAWLGSRRIEFTLRVHGGRMEARFTATSGVRAGRVRWRQSRAGLDGWRILR